MDWVKQNAYDVFGTTAVVGGILFSSGVGVRNYLGSDDTVHWLSWVGLIMIAASELVAIISWFLANGLDGAKAMKQITMVATLGAFVALTVWMFVEVAQDHSAVSVGTVCAGDTDADTILRGPAIMEIGIAGNPGLDTLAAWTFLVSVTYALMPAAKRVTAKGYDITYENGKPKWGMFFDFATFALLVAMGVLVTMISLKIDNKDVFHSGVIGDAGLQEDINDARMQIYGVILGAMLSLGIGGLTRAKSFKADGLIDNLHLYLSGAFVLMTLAGSIILLLTTHEFWEDHGTTGDSFVPDYLCDSESRHKRIALGNTLFAFFFPLALTMAWRAFKTSSE